MPKDINNLQAWIPGIVFGKEKLINIQTGDFLAFETDAERESAKRILSGMPDETKEGK